MNEQTDGDVSSRTDRRTNELTDRCPDEQVTCPYDGWADGWKDERMDGQESG